MYTYLHKMLWRGFLNKRKNTVTNHFIVLLIWAALYFFWRMHHIVAFCYVSDRFISLFFA